MRRGKNTTHKSLYSMRNERAWPNNVGRANGSSPFGEVTIKYVCIVGLRFSDHRTKEMLGVIG